MIDIDKVKFDEKGLVPAVVQEAVDKAKASLVDFGENAEFLRALVDYLITRNK